MLNDRDSGLGARDSGALVLLLLVAGCRAGGCGERPPPAPTPPAAAVEAPAPAPTRASEVRIGELPPSPAAVADAGPADAGADAGAPDAGRPDAGRAADAGPADAGAGADAGPEEDEAEDGGPDAGQGCPKPPEGVRCSVDCWCAPEQAVTLGMLRGLAPGPQGALWAGGAGLLLLGAHGQLDVGGGGGGGPFTPSNSQPHRASALWPGARGDLWLLSTDHGPVWHWDGRSLSETAINLRPNELRALWGSGDQLWAVGAGGAVLRGDGRLWESEASPTTDLLESVWGEGGVVWAVGANGAVARRDRGVWSAVESGTNAWLNGVWAAGPDAVWIAGNDGLVLRGGQRGLRRVESGTDQPLFAVWGRAADDVWAVGGRGTVLHWDGRSFKPQRTDTAFHLRSVLGDGHTVWAVGDSGTVLWHPE